MLKEFKEFAMRGNVMDMAIGIIIGAAFGKIVSSLVADIIMPIVGLLTGGVDFSEYYINLSGGEYPNLAAAQEAGAATINIGVFVNTVLDFVIVAFAIFMMIKQMNRLKRKEEAAPAAPPPPSGVHPLRIALPWLALWLAPLAALSLAGAPLLAQIGWFFAWLAVVTFGGAYAVLAYMTQTVVDGFGWISAAQMIDALGLAETTPGPLILVTQFVAMLTGQIAGGAGLAIAAGAVALWATFLPCFLWIFLAAPYLERLAARPRLAAALRGITAAVSGVILNLSLWFALHVLFDRIGQYDLGPLSLPRPDPGALDVTALALVALAALLMPVAKRGMGETLAALAAAGVVCAYL